MLLKRPAGFWAIALIWAVPALFYFADLAGLVAPYASDPQAPATIAVNAFESVLVLVAVGALFALKGVCVPLFAASCGVDVLDQGAQLLRGADPALFLFTLLLNGLLLAYLWRLRRRKTFASFW